MPPGSFSMARPPVPPPGVWRAPPGYAQPTRPPVVIKPEKDTRASKQLVTVMHYVVCLPRYLHTYTNMHRCYVFIRHYAGNYMCIHIHALQMLHRTHGFVCKPWVGDHYNTCYKHKVWVLHCSARSCFAYLPPWCVHVGGGLLLMHCVAMCLHVLCCLHLLPRGCA